MHGGGLQISQVAGNIPSKQTWPANMGWPLSFGVSLIANNSNHKNIIASDFDG